MRGDDWDGDSSKMRKPEPGRLPVLQPNLQLSFYHRLQAIESLHLQPALETALRKLDLRALDRELAEYVGQKPLKRLASFGLRGEVFFPVPCILEANPFLLGYYRLLLGFSQKECYTRARSAGSSGLRTAATSPTA